MVAFGRAFSFNLLTPRLATLVRTDMPLTLVIFLIGLVIWQKLRTNERLCRVAIVSPSLFASLRCDADQWGQSFMLFSCQG